MDSGVADVGSLTTQLTKDHERDAYVRALLRRGDDDCVSITRRSWWAPSRRAGYRDVVVHHIGLVAQRASAGDLPSLGDWAAARGRRQPPSSQF